MIRLGQRDRETNDRQTSSRQILVEFRSYTCTKNQVMESLYKLKNANAHFRQLSVTHETIKIERSEIQSRSPAVDRMADRTAPVVKLTLTLTLLRHILAKTGTSPFNGPIVR